MAMNQSCYALQGKTHITQMYLFFMTSQCVNYLKQNTGGATFETIIIDTFDRLTVTVPSKQLIDEFTTTVGPLMKTIRYHGSKNQNLRQTRDLLLPKLISGQIDVEDLDIKVA